MLWEGFAEVPIWLQHVRLVFFWILFQISLTHQLGFPILSISWSERRINCVLWWWLHLGQTTLEHRWGARHLQGCCVSLGSQTQQECHCLLSRLFVLCVCIILCLFWKLFDTPEASVFGDDRACFVPDFCRVGFLSLLWLLSVFSFCVLLNSSLKYLCLELTSFLLKSPWCCLDKLVDVSTSSTVCSQILPKPALKTGTQLLFWCHVPLCSWHLSQIGNLLILLICCIFMRKDTMDKETLRQECLLDALQILIISERTSGDLHLLFGRKAVAFGSQQVSLQ